MKGGQSIKSAHLWQVLFDWLSRQKTV